LREKIKRRVPRKKDFTRRIAAKKHAAARSGKENAAYRCETSALRCVKSKCCVKKQTLREKIRN
jgi:hypothetical protein